MNYVVYFFVALIAASSVLFGLDFQSAPMPPMPASPYALRAAVPPLPPGAATAETKSEATASAVAGNPAAVPPPLPPKPPAAPDPVVAVAPPPPSIVADEPAKVAAAPPRCDLDACAAAYRSFTPEDCTYQPSDGPRRLCTKGKPPVAASTPVAASPVPEARAIAPEARAQACNIAACSQSYPRSFSSADCTFQPSEGPRRLCTK